MLSSVATELPQPCSVVLCVAVQSLSVSKTLIFNCFNSLILRIWCDPVHVLPPCDYLVLRHEREAILHQLRLHSVCSPLPSLAGLTYLLASRIPRHGR